MNNTVISNVGAAGNDWTANALTLAGGSAAQTLTVQTTGTGVSALLKVIMPASGTFVAGVEYLQGDGTGSANNMGYSMGYSGGGGYFNLGSRDIDGASADSDIFRVLDGQTTIDANTTWDINVFDDYDDAMVLWRAFAAPNRLNIYDQGRNLLRVNTNELVEMGVLRKYPDGWIGHNDMRMEALLAGGIYQNRAYLERLENRLEVLESIGGR